MISQLEAFVQESSNELQMVYTFIGRYKPKINLRKFYYEPND